jgi:hypothetical protein
MEVLFVMVSFAVSGRGLPVDPILNDQSFNSYLECEAELREGAKSETLFTKTKIEQREDNRIRVVSNVGSGKKFTYCIGPIIR